MANRIILNETSYFGKNARSILPEEINKRHYKKALLVSDESLMNCGVTKMVLDVLDENDIKYELFTNVKPNPTVSNVKEGLKLCEDIEADYIIAVGGGSVIDTAKAISIIKTNPEFNDVVSLVGVADTKNKALPLIALPTTHGTAAEVTINYVITDEEKVVKMVCVDPNDIPVLAIIDTDLMATLPRSVAASTGLDALTHAIEGYITKAAWSMTDMFHIQAMKMIYDNLEKACNKDEDALENMGVAQYIAGMGFSNVGLGIVHSMAHQLGAVYDTPHGVANALLLPYVMKFNGPSCVGKFKVMGKLFGADISGTDDEVIDNVVAKVRDLAIRLDIPQHISEIGGNRDDIDMLSEKALNDPCTPGNPRDVTKEDIKKIFEEAF